MPGLEKVPFEYDLKNRFPFLQEIRRYGETPISIAEDGDRFFLVFDERWKARLAETPDHRDNPRELLDALILVYEYTDRHHREHDIALLAAYPKPDDDRDDRENRGEGGAPVVARPTPPPPTRGPGMARGFEESDAPPRDP